MNRKETPPDDIFAYILRGQIELGGATLLERRILNDDTRVEAISWFDRYANQELQRVQITDPERKSQFGAPRDVRQGTRENVMAILDGIKTADTFAILFDKLRQPPYETPPSP